MSRELMLASLQKRFVPVLRGRGFKGSLPNFQRVREDRIELLSVQFDKWGGGFVIEIGLCSPDGIKTHWGEEIPPNKVTVQYLDPEARHRLGASTPGSDGRWFRYDDGTSVNAVADGAAETLGEAELWWDQAVIKPILNRTEP